MDIYLIVIGAAVIVGAVILLAAILPRKIKSTSSTDGSLVYSGEANHFLNGESVGGKLFLTNDQLHFKSHKFNIQNHEMQLDIHDIKEVRFYNMLGFIRNMLEVETTNGVTEKFVVNNRAAWKEQIDKLKG
jgi:hypothetical protein